MPEGAPRLVSATIASREFRAPGFWCIRLRSDYIAQHARPAQYVAVDLPGVFAVRLPLGIYTTEGDTFSLLFQKWGDRTTAFADMHEGETVSCIGPLGNSFTLPSKNSTATIASGGLGVAAFWMLAKELRAAKISTTILLGARTKELLVGKAELERFGFPIEICTDDGSQGFKGNVVERLGALAPAGMLYGCGPPGMLRALCAFANKSGTPCQVSMEETFGCSLGTCWGCVVPVRRGCPQGTGYPKAPHEQRDCDFSRVCTDGTVFLASDVIWTA